MLTSVNLLLRIAGTSFHVYLSRKIGAAGIGLLQLVMSVGSFAMVAGIAGVRTAAMYLTAEELGKKRPENTSQVLSASFQYSILFSGSVSLILYVLAPLLARVWISNSLTVAPLRVLAAFLPLVCLCGVLSGYFTAEKKIGTLAAIEVVEQLFSIVVTLTGLTLWAGNNAQKACLIVVLGNGLSTCLTFALLLLVHLREKRLSGPHFPIRKRLLQAALPLAFADVVRSGIGTAENLLVPKRLKYYPGESSPLSSFGKITGMVFPLMMFPACILYALAELLIPELAGCNASGNIDRIRHLVLRSLWVAMIYGVFCSGIIYLLAIPLCNALYKSPDAGMYLKQYAILIPFLYCDAITDAMTKGLGQQKICVRYNILTSAMDVLLLFLLLPKYGMHGYYSSFTITHLLNFALSFRRLLTITGCRIPFYYPAFAAVSEILSIWIAAKTNCSFLYLACLPVLLCGFKVIRKQDFHWISHVVTGKTAALTSAA